MTELTIPLRSHDEAVLVLGPYDRYAKLLRKELDIELFTRNGNLRVKGDSEGVQEARRRIEHLLGKVRKGRDLDLGGIENILLGATQRDGGPEGSRSNSGSSGERVAAQAGGGDAVHRSGTALTGFGGQAPVKRARVRAVEPRNEAQRRYLDLMARHDLVIAQGPAGTGKTFLAVAAAVKSLRSGESRRLVITRPVVEAGEHLGFLPGDLQAKLNPYMRPVYDALYTLLDFEDVGRLEETAVIEVAPLAYMRGRTLSSSFVILDEAQNTTIPQMKMFLTRMGEGSKMVVTGDPSQNDLESGQRSGLNDAVARLRGFQSVGQIEFSPKDIVRHPLVEQIVRAYQGPSPVDRGPDRGPDRGSDRGSDRGAYRAHDEIATGSGGSESQ
jgi:phosphate starvation-inducible PhoH-like protein